MKAFTKIIVFTAALFMAGLSPLFTACQLFEVPQGEAELLDIYTYAEQGLKENSSTEKEDKIRFITATIKISNTGDINIYNSTINVSAETNKRTYYKTLSLDITIPPEHSIFIPVEMEIDLKQKGHENETWKTDSMCITDSCWR